MTRWRWILVGVVILSGFLILPVAAYVVGGRVVGPYQGPRGLGSYLGAIYGDVGRGRPLALVIVLGPALCLMVWELRAWLGRSLTGREEPD